MPGLRHLMRSFLDLGDDTVEVDLSTPWHLFSAEETRRRLVWSLAARLAFWMGLTLILLAVALFALLPLERL